MNVLFVCSRNRLRSPTAEALFANEEGIATLSAGTAPDAETPVTGDLIEWADMIIVMEQIHRRRLAERFGDLLHNRRIIVLGIPDNYRYMQPELVELLRKKVGMVIDR